MPTVVANVDAQRAVTIPANVFVIAFFAASGSSDRATTMPACMIAPSSRCVSGSIAEGSIRPDVRRDRQHGFDGAEGIALVELVPQVPTQHGGTVEHHDALHLGVEALVQERVESHLQDPHRVRLPAAGGDLQHLRGQLVLDLFEGGLEQVCLAREVVVRARRGSPPPRSGSLRWMWRRTPVPRRAAERSR